MNGKTVFVVGGSSGLGKEISKVLASQGAHVTIFARKQELLDEAKDEIIAVRATESQRFKAVASDMSHAATAHSTLAAQRELPDTLYCVAGGTANELGYLMDLEPDQIERCMNNNYYSSLYPAQAVLRAWVQDDKSAGVPKSPKARSIVFVNSTASLTPIPGYLAYSAGKSAQRALADTLRLEIQRYSGPISTYSVQCVFAHNFITPTFIEEQRNKPELTKRLEGTTGDLSKIEKGFPYAEKIAPEIVANVAKGDFAIMDGRFEPQACWAVSIGSSPKRGFGIWDTILAVLMAVIFPFIRNGWEKECRGDALKKK
ncbi:short chain dehydrogenase [Karstenula rhodostoma CBS 690.94]|uniref:Short chain dehydrogenase n=1 Tax=Karstenula rhodostoma CBS 690.94 TaxID=1392251 RepID=A0A9P4PHT6_9PLEO|nr:short chain dehydrogenase [Karstenula rhodostoma CBS 690.94]